MPIDTTADAFDEATAAGLVLVDFWAPWCGPCKALAPTLDEMETDYEGEVRIVKVDIEAHPSLAERFSVRNIPQLVLMRDGAEIDRAVGALTKTRLAALVEQGL